MDDICHKAGVPGMWFRNGVANHFLLFALTFENYSFVGFMLVIEVTVIQFTEMGACLHNFHEHLMQLLFLALYCLPKTISAKYLKVREAWEKFKPIILIIVQHS